MGCGRLCTSCGNAATSMYFWASFVYCVYVYQILAVDYCEDLYPRSPKPHFNDTNSSSYENEYDYDYVVAPQCKGQGDTPLNRQYIAASSVHILNGVMYGLVWIPYFKAHPYDSKKRRFFLLLPEFLNICEASLYVKSASLYGTAYATCQSPHCDLYLEMHIYETIAATLEMIASFGWFWSWYVTYHRGPGKGITVWDPDFLGAVGLIIPSIIYVVYNIQNLTYPEGFFDNYLFVVADILYGIDAPLYLFAALRDAGCFWWLKCVPGCVESLDSQKLLGTGSVSPTPLPLDDAEKSYGTRVIR